MGEDRKKTKKKGALTADKLSPRKGSKGSKDRKGSKGSKERGKPLGPDAADIIAAARAAAFADNAPARAFAHFRPLAEKVPTAGLPVFTGQPLLMRANILVALDAIEPHLVAAVNALREPKLEQIFELPSLVMALDFAVVRVPVAKLSAKEIEKMLAEGAPWRDLMLRFLEVAAHPLIGLLPRERVAAVRAGKGKLDQAQDFVAIPGLFAEFATALEGKHPFPADKLDLLSTLGGTLVQHVRPGNAVAEVAKRASESILRDQFASLVAERYDQLQVLAAVALGKRKADDLLPALRTAIAPSRGEESDEEESVTLAAAAAAAPAATEDAQERQAPAPSTSTSTSISDPSPA